MMKTHSNLHGHGSWPEKIFILANGDVLSLGEKEVSVWLQSKNGNVYIDSNKEYCWQRKLLTKEKHFRWWYVSLIMFFIRIINLSNEIAIVSSRLHLYERSWTIT